MTATPQKIRLVDAPDVREIYSDKLVGASFAGGAMVVTLGAARFIPDQLGQGTDPNQTTVFVNNRIALSPQLAVELVNALTQMINAAQQAQAQQAQAQAQAAAAKPGPSGQPS